MALVNKPDESIFASSAKQGEVDNFPDLLRGWGISFEQTGGIPPMEWFNFLFKRLDEKHTYLMQRGLPEWSATQDYPAGAFVQYQGLSYKALRTNKNSPPSASNSADWQRWGFTLTEIAKASLTQQGIVQLNSATNSDNETMAATPKAVKTAYDLANGKQSPATTLAGYGIGNFKVEPFVGNLNTLKTDGVYAITQASRSQNLPVSTSCHIQVIAGGDGAWCRQLAYVAYSTDVYERHQTSYQTDSWSPWVKIDSLDKIPNSKKSSAVDSDSADTVATSAAVKIAYDKGVEAKTAADGAQSTANDGVAKAKTAQAAAEAAQRTANDGVSKATTAQNTANNAVTKADNAQRAADNANNNANNRVSKSGDTMTGSLAITGSQSGGFANGLMLKNKAGGQNTGVFVDFYQTDNIPRASMWMRDAGKNSTQIEFLNTPEGADWNIDSRQNVFTITSSGNLWSRAYGWLHDKFASKSEVYVKSRFRSQWYPNHYEGAGVFDVPMGDNGVMRTIIMGATIDGYAKLNLPESFNGAHRVQVMDVGSGRHVVGANIQNGNVVEVFNSGHTGLNIIAIGWYGW
nr:MAG TPA: Baseplate structural protein [Caudoviricetes sp.]